MVRNQYLGTLFNLCQVLGKIVSELADTHLIGHWVCGAFHALIVAIYLAVSTVTAVFLRYALRAASALL
jgi:hypothetical protein